MRRNSGDQAGGKRISHAGTTGFGLGTPGAPPAGPPPQWIQRPPEVRQVESSPWLGNARVVPMGIALFLVVAIGSAGVASRWNAPGFHASWHFLNFYTGVFALVALSISVMIGLAASDQLVMAPRQRVLAQAVHRGAAFTAVAMLVVHVLCQLGSGHIRLIDAIVPFMAAHRPDVVGLGVVAAYLMIAVCVSGIIRGRFAAGRHPGAWRAVHALAYLSWPPAIIHGLMSGRSAAGWVTLSYILCVLAVVLALPTRLVTRARAGRRP